jgi:hypothetical protein
MIGEGWGLFRPVSCCQPSRAGTLAAVPLICRVGSRCGEWQPCVVDLTARLRRGNESEGRWGLIGVGEVDGNRSRFLG